MMRKENRIMPEKEKSSLMYERWFKEILHQLLIDLRDFPYAMIKGPILSLQAYDDVCARNYHDIDFLIPKEMRKDFLLILKKNGFVADVRNKDGSFRELKRNEEIILMNSHQDIDYIKFCNDIYVDVDINYNLFWGEYRGKEIDLKSEFLSETFLVEIFGQEVKVLSKAKNFIQLCLHHYREMNAIYFYKLSNPFIKSKFTDVYHLFKNMTENDLIELKSLIKRYEIENYIYYVLYYTYQFYSDILLKLFIGKYETPEARAVINFFGLNDFERKEWPFSLKERAAIENLYEALIPYLSKEDIRKVENAVGFITLTEQ